MSDAIDLEDIILPFQVDKFGLRGRIVRLGPSVNKILGAHRYPEVVNKLLAENMVLCTLLASALKFDGVFSLQAVGQGPMKALISDLNSAGDLRGYAGFDEAGLAAAEERNGELLTRLFGGGQMAFTVDQGKNMQPYQGITPLGGDNLTECARSYFAQSEQVDSVFKVALGEKGAAGIMLQRLPEESLDPDVQDKANEDWREAVVLLSSMTEAELLDPALSPSDLLYRLYHEQGIIVYEPRTVQAKCRCSSERVENAILSCPLPEIDGMIDDGGTAVTCHFCSKEYAYSVEQLNKLRDLKIAQKEAEKNAAK